MENNNWEEFEPGLRNKASAEMYVSLHKSGSFYLNAKAVEALGKPEFVVMLYDRSRRRIGLKAAPPSKRNGFLLSNKETGRSHGRVIYAAEFCQTHKIRPKRTHMFVSPVIEKDGILMLRLELMRPVNRES
jgi:hypothetical protein